MKNVKLKIIGMALAAAMIFGNGQVLASQCNDYQAQQDPESYATTLRNGQTVRVSLSADNDNLDLYKFVAPNTGAYYVAITRLEHSEEGTPYISIFQEVIGDWDGGCESFTCYLTQGDTYYISAWTDNENAASEYTFSISYVSQTDGWFIVDNTWYYASHNYLMTGWQKINGAWYYFDDAGAMQTGWLKSPGNGKWYYLNERSGYMMTNTWLCGNTGLWYYVGETGFMVTGWRDIEGKRYLFDVNSGAMVKGWKMVGGEWYYFNPNGGAMVTGWKNIDGKWYYFQSNGAMKKGWLATGNKWYFFRADGSMVTGEITIGNSIYYFDASGAMISG